jgi:hypothetical protein
MIKQHDAARADPDGACAGGDMRDTSEVAALATPEIWC